MGKSYTKPFGGDGRRVKELFEVEGDKAKALSLERGLGVVSGRGEDVVFFCQDTLNQSRSRELTRRNEEGKKNVVLTRSLTLE